MIRRAATLGAALAMLALPVCAQAAFPGANGKIAYERAGAIWTMNADGTGETQITNGTSSEDDRGPAWSPDGTKIAFKRDRGSGYDIYVMNADGSGAALAISNAGTSPSAPAWSPAGDEIAFGAEVVKANLDGSGRTVLYDYLDSDGCCADAPAWSPSAGTIAFDLQEFEPRCSVIDEDDCRDVLVSRIARITPPSRVRDGPSPWGAAPDWSPDGRHLVFHTTDYAEYPSGEGSGRIGLMNADGSDRHLITPTAGYTEPAWSPDGTKLVFQSGPGTIRVMNTDGTGDTFLASGRDPSWQPVQRPHARPKGATPFRVSLVPAMKPCTAPNREHGPPLAFGSCSPPQPESPNITVSQGDARLRSVGSVRMDVLAGAPGAPDDTDVQIRFSLTNVMQASDFADYTGTLTASIGARLTDRDAGQSSTTQDFPMSYAVPCAATADTFLGSTCASTTSLDAVVAGAAAEGSRAIWALDRLQVYDEQDVLFATQGVFVP